MIPILFNHDATSFSTHGIGDLMETIACESVVNSEGEYELELQYPADGPMIGSLAINNIIVAKVNDHGAYQAFRIYGIDKAVNRLVTVHAQHLSYDLACVPVMSYESTTCSNALASLKQFAVSTLANPFTFYTDIPNSQQALNQDRKFKMEEPLALRAALLDGDDSIFGCWEGDLVFDNYTVKFLKLGSTDADAGKNRGVLIEYGIDMIDMQQEENISEMITGVFPYWKGREEGNNDDDITVYGDVQYASGTFQRQRVVPLNVTEYYPNNTSSPTKAQINQTARDWMMANKVGQPVINLTISYAELGKDVRLHDAVTVRFVKIGIDVMAKVISYKYDVLKERCIEVEVGNVKPSILFSMEDASRLKRGLLPPQRIQNNSITSDKIENYGISGSNLSTGAVGTRTIGQEAVTESKIGQWAVTTDKIGGMAVTTGKIANGGVTNEKIGDLAISTGKIQEGAVVEAKIGNSAITSVKIKDGEVITAKLHDNAVTTQKVADLAIDEAKIGNSAITSMKIKDGSVVEAKIGNAAVTTNKVADLAIDNAKIGNSAITSVKIKDGEVGTVKLADKAVVTAKLGDGSITTAKIANLAVDEAKIGNSAITSLKIQNAAVDKDKIKDGAVIESKIGNGAVTTTKVADLAIDSAKIGNSAITSVKIKDGEVKEAKIANGAVVTGKLANGAVTTVKVEDLAIDSAKIGNSAITSVKIQNAAVEADKIKDGAVIEAKVDTGAITTTKVADLAIDTAKIGDSAITSLKIKNGEVVKGKFGPKAIEYADVEDYQMDQLKLGYMSVTVDKLGQDGWVQKPNGEWDYRAKAIETIYERDEHGRIKYDENGNPIVLENAPPMAPNAVVQMHIGDKQVANIKLVKDVQDNLAAVWEVDSLVSSVITTDQLGGKIIDAKILRGTVVSVGGHTLHTSGTRVTSISWEENTGGYVKNLTFDTEDDTVTVIN